MIFEKVSPLLSLNCRLVTWLYFWCCCLDVQSDLTLFQNNNLNNNNNISNSLLLLLLSFFCPSLHKIFMVQFLPSSGTFFSLRSDFFPTNTKKQVQFLIACRLFLSGWSTSCIFRPFSKTVGVVGENVKFDR